MTIELPDVERSALSIGVQRAVTRSGLSKIDFARRCGVSPSTLALWIKGATVPTEANLSRVARLLGVTQDDLREGLPNLLPESAA
nr:helix-turn-helix transcriptional regulator [Pseudonocardia acaciae]